MKLTAPTLISVQEILNEVNFKACGLEVQC